MNYRVIITYVFLIGFFSFLVFAYFNYSKTVKHLSAPSNQSMDMDDFEKAVEKVILENPELVIRALEKYEEKRMKEAIEQSTKQVKEHKKALEETADDPRLGDKNARIKMIEFFDYNCIYCKRMAPVKARIIKENPDIEYIFKENPMLGDESILAAKYALAVNSIDRSKYLAFHMAVMEDNGHKTDESLLKIASKIGVDITKLKSVLKEIDFNSIINANLKLLEKLDIPGVPRYIIGDEVVRTPGYAQIIEKINELRRQNAEQLNSGNTSSN